jgi:large subunit ribosomal protein L35
MTDALVRLGRDRTTDPWSRPGAFFFATALGAILPAVAGAWGKNGATMPKMKTHKASKKRFRVTATGKLKRRQAGKKHLLSHKSGKRKRHLRGVVIDNNKLSKKYIEMMGGHA